jgi:prolyl-tRNA editing enzyme YbaK/EbsC (Cys-tRNA(Pro) deacylase)
MECQPLSPSAYSLNEHVRPLDEYLRANGVSYEFLYPGRPMPTVPLAAAAIGVEERQILKSILFEGRNGEIALAIASGPSRIDREALAAVSGLVVPRLAKLDIVMERTGFPAGGVSAVGHATEFPVFIDEAVMELDEAFCGGGHEDVLLRLRLRDIVRLTNASIVTLTVANSPNGTSSP